MITFTTCRPATVYRTVVTPGGELSLAVSSEFTVTSTKGTENECKLIWFVLVDKVSLLVTELKD